MFRLRQPSYDDLRKARPRAAASLDEVVVHERADEIRMAILEELDDEQINHLAIAVSHGRLEVGWDDEGSSPTLELTDKYWRDYGRLIFGA